MTTELPRTVPVGDVEEWSDEVDVVVVGAGMGGSAAAVEAARAGARVLVLDRGGPGTCTTAMAGGHFYLGGGTPVQKATGHENNPEAMANGALGGKVIGAGGGGFLMFYAGDKVRLRHAMRERGLSEVRFRFDFEGTRILNQ